MDNNLKRNHQFPPTTKVSGFPLDNSREIKKVAVVVGHTAGSKGAKSPYLPDEYDFNLEVANKLKKHNCNYDVYTHRTYSVGYYNMWKETANKINSKDYDLVIELHYNAASPKAHGTETLYYFNSKKGKAYAQIFSETISEDFGTKLRGIQGAKPLVNKNDRGFYAVYLPKPPALIVEPFFGSNEEESVLFKDTDKYAESLHKAIQKCLFFEL